MKVYIARQPILNRNNVVEGYELLFRNSSENYFKDSDSSYATLDVLKNSFSLIGMDKLTDGKKAYINFDDQLIKSGIIETLPKESVVIEILETVAPSEEIVATCKTLKEKGYCIALDDFEFVNDYTELFKYVDIIKVDFLATKGIERRDIINRIGDRRIKFLAEKVETHEDFQEALNFGYTLFQGYYFCKPSIISSKDIAAFQSTYIKLINELNEKEVNIDKIEEYIKRDISLSYKILMLVNSAHYGLRSEVDSIKRAVVLLGIIELKRWIYIITLKSVKKEKPDEIIKMSLLRAYFGELVMKNLKKCCSPFEMFLTGMFSMIDVLMEKSMEDILFELPLSGEVKDALLGRGNLLSDILNLIKNYETGNWKEVNNSVFKLGLERDFVNRCYIEAIEIVQKIKTV